MGEGMVMGEREVTGESKITGESNVTVFESPPLVLTLGLP